MNYFYANRKDKKNMSNTLCFILNFESLKELQKEQQEQDYKDLEDP